MEDGGKKGNDDLYKIMGLKMECSSGEVRKAYKKLAMRWHPDRCSASKNEEAKSKFQAIQEAYSVLSDTHKRSMYDVGICEEEEDSDEDEGMRDIFYEIAAMMSKIKPSENKKESLEELQGLFNEIFRVDANGSFGI